MQSRSTLEKDHAKAQVRELFRAPENVVIVHYALQTLRRARSEPAPAVAAIAVRHLGSGRQHIFSIKSEADAAGINLSELPSAETLTRLEYQLLFKYNDFLAELGAETGDAARFVHWYMRDDKFGFAALELRFQKVLSDVNAALFGARSPEAAAPYGFGGGSPFPVRIPASRKVDLAKVIRDIYAGGPLSLREIADRNGLAHEEMIAGELEPGAFENGNHARLQWSTATKTRLIAEILDLVHEDRLVLTPKGPASRAGEGRIFINYRREDSEAAASRINFKLAQAFGEASVFFDIDDIPAGIDFVDVLREQIDACDIFLAVIGRSWHGATDAMGRLRIADPNDFVRSEIRAALKRGIPVIPVLVDGASMPGPGELPDDIDALRRRQAIELRTQRHIEFNSDSEWLVLRIRETMKHVRGGAFARK